MIPFHLISGFLGSGKTTLLHNILQHLGDSKRVAVIQNEFAPTGVDGKILSKENSNFHLTEINNGSVFCVCQLNNFVSTVQKLVASYQPEVIFLESSGLADPISVAELLQTPDLSTTVSLGGIFTLVDAFNYQKGLSGLTRFKHQIMVADKLILNKVDLVENGLNEIETSLKTLNPFAPVEQTSFAHITWNTFEKIGTQAGKSAQRFYGTSSEGRPNTKALVLRSHKKISSVALHTFLAQLQNKCIRIKGFVNITNNTVVGIQSVFEQMETKVIEGYVGQTELVVFSDSLQISDLRKLYKINCVN